MESEGQKIVELSDESFLFKEMTWKIPKEQILPNVVDQDVKSPPFSFAGADWILHIYPYGRILTHSVGWIELVIERLDYKIPQQLVFYKFNFKTHRGKEFNPVQTSYGFSGNYGRGWLPYMQKNKYFFNENVLTVNGAIVIQCQMRTHKIDGIEVFSQTEEFDSVLELSAEIPKLKPFSSAVGCKESPEIKSRQELESSANAKKEPTGKKSTEKLKSSAPTCTGCDCTLRHTLPLPGTKTLRDFKELFLKQEDCDVTIKVKGREFLAHRNILKARSSVFASTFRNDMKEKATGVIDIEDCDPSSFSDFLCFLYCGNLENLTKDNVFSLFSASDKYDVQDLRLECMEFMKTNLSVDTFCDTIALALQHSEKLLLELTTDFFSKNLQEIIVTVKWQSFLVENPIPSNELLIKVLVSNRK